MIHVSYSKLSKELKNDIDILVGQASFKFWIKIVKMLFWTQVLAYLYWTQKLTLGLQLLHLIACF